MGKGTILVSAIAVSALLMSSPVFAAGPIEGSVNAAVQFGTDPAIPASPREEARGDGVTAGTAVDIRHESGVSAGFGIKMGGKSGVNEDDEMANARMTKVRLGYDRKVAGVAIIANYNRFWSNVEMGPEDWMMRDWHQVGVGAEVPVEAAGMLLRPFADLALLIYDDEGVVGDRSGSADIALAMLGVKGDMDVNRMLGLSAEVAVRGHGGNDLIDPNALDSGKLAAGFRFNPGLPITLVQRVEHLMPFDDDPTKSLIREGGETRTTLNLEFDW